MSCWEGMDDIDRWESASPCNDSGGLALVDMCSESDA
eukprot:CAMPEP_0113591490 /NCGR_PEP_ID=MMETSP0015_2-20120614/37299_1 /TAXON_ID=2838 /ORGANISM="Odontella" /LENGTH=36 /DNA_ID=CAMNT_0000497879 /DNA_START=176 /DNA_END=286 /DNA_ORIENTATION=+ /assembly_acc=CAM_ASM_000160